MKSTLLAIATITLVTVTVPVHAQERIIESRVVSYQDLNLSTDAGVKALTRRIRNAAEVVCGGRGSASGLQQKMLFEECVTKARHETDVAMAAKMGRSFASR